MHYLVTRKGTSALWAGKQTCSSNLRTVPKHRATMVLAAGSTSTEITVSRNTVKGCERMQAEH